MTDLEVVRGEVISFDQARAAITLRKIDAAMQTWVRSTVELADLAYEARLVECWRVDEDFAAARAAGAIAPAVDRNWGRVWLGWKFNRAGRTVEMLADYGELRSIIAADSSLPVLAEPEGVARPLGRLLRPRYLPSEAANIDERDDAIRQIWRDAHSSRFKRSSHPIIFPSFATSKTGRPAVSILTRSCIGTSLIATTRHDRRC